MRTEEARSKIKLKQERCLPVITADKEEPSKQCTALASKMKLVVAMKQFNAVVMPVADIYHQEFYSFIYSVAKIAVSSSYFPLQGKIATMRKHATHAKCASAKCQGVH